MTDEPGTIAAATRNGAADEMSPGIVELGQASVDARSTVTLVGRRVTRAPARSSSRSVWSRVGHRLDDRRAPLRLHPASRIADFTCAEATGSS